MEITKNLNINENKIKNDVQEKKSFSVNYAELIFIIMFFSISLISTLTLYSNINKKSKEETSNIINVKENTFLKGDK